MILSDSSLLFRNEDSFKNHLDDPLSRFHGRDIFTEGLSKKWRSLFTYVKFNPDWLNSSLNTRFCRRYHELCGQMFSQTDIKDYIIQHSSSDVVILILIDGLSYYDVKHLPNMKPCLVPGPSTTWNGFRNITQDGAIAYGLHWKGYTSRIGFSHWDRQYKDTLADSIFNGFTQSSMNQVNEFDEVLQMLSKIELHGYYIQMLLEGYDQLSHGYHGRPNFNIEVNRIFESVLPELVRMIRERGLTSDIYLTSDHGVWWKHRVGDKKDYKVIGTASGKMRYTKGISHGNEYIIWETDKTSYSLLKYPFLLRKYKKNEWGVHGGISIYESLVPFYNIKVK